MLERVRFFIVSVLFLSAAPYAYTQSHKLPEPIMSTTGTPPPPPGLPLPIDDYLPLLFLAGAIYGAIKIPKLNKN